MVNCTNDFQPSIQQVQSFLEPTEGFISGYKIYEPAERDPQRDLKTEIIEFGERVIRECKSGRLSQATISELHADAEMYRSKAKTLSENSDAEHLEYSAFSTAIVQLIENCCSVRSLEA